MALLLLARALVALAPFAWWRGWLGMIGVAKPEQLAWAKALASHVSRAATRLGLPLKCLPRAMALSWLLQRREIAHRVIVAARPQAEREGAPDALHAWVECGEVTILGAIAGPWIVVLELP